MINNNEIKYFIALLQFFIKKKALDVPPAERKLTSICSPLRKNEILSICCHHDIFRCRSKYFFKKYIYLETPKQLGNKAILFFNFKFKASDSIITVLRIFLYFYYEGATHPLSAYRFESPDNLSMHNYFHAQPTYTGCNPLFEKVPKVVFSSRIPAFPVNASDSFELLASMIVSLYGPNELRDFVSITVESKLREKLNNYVKKLIII